MRRLSGLGLLVGCTVGTGSWTPMSDVGAPVARTRPVTVWTGEEVFVWGGWIPFDGPGCLDRDPTRTGALYDPSTDAWRPVSEAGGPETLEGAAAYWTGSEVLIWLDDDTRSEPPTIARYDVGLDAWTSAVSPPGMLEPELHYHHAWTGEEMVVWGNGLRSAAYAPSTDTWRSIATFGTGVDGDIAAVGSSGSEVFVWISPDRDDDGQVIAEAVGGRYDLASDSWSPIATEGAPNTQVFVDVKPATYWTGDDLLIVSPDGSNVSHYDPEADLWSASSGGPGRDEHPSTTWMEGRIAFWGSRPGAAAYDPATREWSRMTRQDRPSKRQYPALQWTGDELVVWGGGTAAFCVESDVEGGAVWRPD